MYWLGALVWAFVGSKGPSSRTGLAASETRALDVPIEYTQKRRVDTYLSEIFTEYSRSQIGELCERGAVIVNEKPKAKNYKVKGGDHITFVMEEKEIMSVAPENIPLDILYEDDLIMAVNKPAGMCVHPGPGNPNGTFVNALLHHVGKDMAARLMDDKTDPHALELEQTGREVDLPETPEAASATPPSVRPGIVHRLDKGTSGVLLAGKTTEAVAALSALFAERDIEKTYLAVCVGHPGDSTIMEPIGRHQKNRQLMTVYDEDDDGPVGKPAISHTKTFAFDGKLSAALVRIETGRTHQIRVHLQHRRTPIVGDEQYGNNDWNSRVRKAYGVARPLLHAYQVVFRHPFSGEQMLIQAPLPSDIYGMVNRMTPQDEFVGTTDGSRTADLRDSGDGGIENTLLDKKTRLLRVDTHVSGQAPFDAKNKGFVPLDRLMASDEDEFSVNLPEEMDHWQGAVSYTDLLNGKM